MRTLDFFVEWTYNTAAVIDAVTDRFPCFVELKSVEMNWMEVIIEARQEDIASIERMIAEII